MLGGPPGSTSPSGAMEPAQFSVATVKDVAPTLEQRLSACMKQQQIMATV